MSARHSMAKVGRPKIAGLHREPNGRASRRKDTTAVYVQRERDELRAASRKTYLDSPLGLMFRNEQVSAAQYAAGKRFAEDRAEADAALGLPPRNCQAQNVNRLGGVNNAEDSPEQARAKSRTIAAYDKAEAAVGLSTPRLSALQWVVVYEQRPTTYEEVIALKEGLQRLVLFYGGRA